MKPKHTILIQEGDILFVDCWENHKPKRDDSWIDVAYQNTLKYWEKSKKRYPVHPGYVDGIRDLAFPQFGKYHKSIPEQLKNGIEIPSNNIEISQICHQTGQPCGMPCNGEENCIRYAFLESEKVKETKSPLSDKAKQWNNRQRVAVLLAGYKHFGEHPESPGVNTITNEIMEIIYG